MGIMKPPYADPGRAAFEELDTYVQNNLLSGNDPELKPAYSYPMANNTAFKQFSVVGLDSNRKIALATNGVAASAATGVLTFTGSGSADETVTIGSVTYTLKAAPSAANEVLVGADETETAANIAAAINASGTEDVEYGSGTVAHPSVTASAAAGVVTVTAKEEGSDANAIGTTETVSTDASWGDTTLTGGVDSQGVKPIGVMAHAASLGASGDANGQVWYSGCFDPDALTWHDSFDTDAKKEAAFHGAPTPTTILIKKR
jgi:hypothetical protein